MKIEVLKSKIHRVKVTGADLDYIGSITIDEALLEAANLNGPAARKVQKGDIVIIISYALMDFEEAKTFQPTVIFPDEQTNRLMINTNSN